MGCGTGNLTHQIYRYTKKLVGIDLSKKSIDIANQFSLSDNNLSFFHSSIEEFSETYNGSLFTAAIANMTLMDVSNLELVLQSIDKLLVSDGKLLFTITHPFF